jgi:protein-disulfide isomerase
MAMISCFPNYWNLSPPPFSQSISTGVTDDGHPWIGAKAPILEITEFTDYQCFQCKKMHFFLRRLIDAHPDKIRLIHRHYPMDHKVNPIVKEPFHVGSAAMSLVSIYAQTHGKFWEMNDILFNTDLLQETINTRALMKQAGINIGDTAPNIYDPQIQIRLLNDIREGIKLGITGTPAYVIEGQVYLGQIPPELLANITGK